MTQTPLVPLGRVGRHAQVFLKDESAQPFGTFKDRLSSAALSMFKGNVVFGSISYGNTAISFARACAVREGARFVAFVPTGFEDWRLGPSSSGRCITGRDVVRTVRECGSAVLELDLSAKFYADADLEELARSAGLIGEARFVNVTEGLSKPVYGAIATEAAAQMGARPDYCIVQFGAGILANEVRDVFEQSGARTVVVPISTPHPNSLARMLYGPIWVDADALSSFGVGMSRHASPDRTGVARPPYPVHRVTEAQIERGLEIARERGISAEASGSAGLGFLDALPTIEPSYDPDNARVLVINTGNGIDRLAGGAMR